MGGGLTCLMVAALEDPSAPNYQYAEYLGDRCVLALPIALIHFLRH